MPAAADAQRAKAQKLLDAHQARTRAAPVGDVTSHETRRTVCQPSVGERLGRHALHGPIAHRAYVCPPHAVEDLPRVRSRCGVASESPPAHHSGGTLQRMHPKGEPERFGPRRYQSRKTIRLVGGPDLQLQVQLTRQADERIDARTPPAADEQHREIRPVQGRRRKERPREGRSHKEGLYTGGSRDDGRKCTSAEAAAAGGTLTLVRHKSGTFPGCFRY
mmetsp:Transcript_27106/g.83963  ORF Transcript_27106/g.83963 Transcript_27106/m.83963 type:complete len:219 (+) Transcript_27106:319-975(+)